MPVCAVARERLGSLKYRAVLFDLDGTLLNTIDDLADSMNAVLERFGFPAHPVDSYKLLVGDGIQLFVRRALPEDRRDEASVASCVEATREEYARRWAVKTRPYPGVPEMLDAVAARGVGMAVLSNKPDDFTKKCVAKLLPKWSFGVVRGVRADGRKKPDPAGAIETAQELGIAPGEFLYLGDTNTDMWTAVAAGMFPVGALWGFRSREELVKSGAKVLVAEPAEVAALL